MAKGNSSRSSSGRSSSPTAGGGGNTRTPTPATGRGSATGQRTTPRSSGGKGVSSEPYGGTMTQRFARRGQRGGQLGNAKPGSQGK